MGSHRRESHLTDGSLTTTRAEVSIKNNARQDTGYILDQAQTIVEVNRKNMAEQHSYEEIPDTETSLKMVYFGDTYLDLTTSCFGVKLKE